MSQQLLIRGRKKIMLTNQELLKELQKQKTELEKQLKNIEKDIALYEDYKKQLYYYKQKVIKEQLLDVFYNQPKSSDIEIKLTKNPDYLQIHLIKDDKEKFVYGYSISTYTIESEEEFLKLKEKFDNDIKNISKYLNNLKKTFKSLPKQFPTYDHVSNIRITKPAIEMGIFRFTYYEGFHTKYNIKLEFLENEHLQYIMTKYTDGYSFEQIPKTNHHFKIKSESYENNLNIEYSIKAESTFDNLEQSLKNTFMEIEDEFKNITIEID